ncbi:MAG: ChbG/HpnK family deacetylase [Candidatus Brocadia sp.]|nr:ChbG/HpnK family deacetylase [Candidatus Brocadia sp.]MDG6027915.1 ChbG/HpnK family deacetylase [Candidatus Brocadia sp.]
MNDNIIWVNADDFGLTEGLNKGILESASKGILNSVSFMVDAPASADALSIIEKYPGLFERIGLHLNLVGNQGCMRPAYRLLTDPMGNYPARWSNLVKLILRHRGKILEEIEEEVRRQIEAMEDTGIHPSHIDSHDHVHCFPGISDIVVRLSKQYDIQYIRCPYEKATFTSSQFINLKRLLVGGIAGLLRSKIRSAGLTTSNYFSGLTDGGNMTCERMMEILSGYNGGILEIMCHPGIRDSRLQKIFPSLYNWETEVGALTSPQVLKLFSQKIHRSMSV